MPIQQVVGLGHLLSLYPYLHPTKSVGNFIPGTRYLGYRFRDTTTRVKIGFHEAAYHIHQSEPVDFSPAKLGICAAMAEGWAHQTFARLAYEFA